MLLAQSTIADSRLVHDNDSLKMKKNTANETFCLWDFHRLSGLLNSLLIGCY